MLRHAAPAARRRPSARALGWAVAACALGLAGQASAATVTVTGTGPGVPGDGVCGLGEALANAVGDGAASADCAAGTGADRVAFAVGGTFSTVGTPALRAGDVLEIDGAGRSVVLRGDGANRALTVPPGATLTLRALTIGGGTATDCPGVSPYVGCGGGVFNSGSLTLADVTVTGGDAGPGGFGGGLFNRGDMVVRRSTITGNTAASGGGVADLGRTTLENATVSGNPGDGPAVYTTGDVLLRHATLVGAAPRAPGSPALVLVEGEGRARAVNSVLDGPGGVAACAGGVADGGGNVASSAPGCPGIAGDAALGPLGPAGGRTPVHLLGEASAARDTATADGCTPADQRGVARPQGDACDAGSVEARVVTPPPDPDTTPPEVRPVLTGRRGDAGWFTGDVTVAWTVEDPESPVTPGPGCDGTVIRDDTAGRALTCTATSAGGETTGRVEVRRDTAPPRIAVETPAPGGVYRVGDRLTLQYLCEDDTSGVTECAGPRPSGSPVDTSTVGMRTWTYAARDAAGNPAQATSAFRVAYPFGGFPAPPPVPRVSRATAGARLHIQFDLGGDRGADVLAAVAPATSARVACGDGAPQGGTSPVVSAKRGIVYFDARLDRYVLPWRTDRRWAGTCRRLTLRLTDGEEYTADFRFVRPS